MFMCPQLRWHVYSLMRITRLCANDIPKEHRQEEFIVDGHTTAKG